MSAVLQLIGLPESFLKTPEHHAVFRALSIGNFVTNSH